MKPQLSYLPVFLNSIIFCNLAPVVRAASDTKSWYMWPQNTAEKCPEGKGVSQNDCFQAALAFVPSDRPLLDPSNLIVQNHAHFPCGCFIWENPDADHYAILFSTKTTGCSINMTGRGSNMLCTVPPTTGEQASLHLWPTNLKDRCPLGHDVSQENCYKAGLALLPDGKPLANTGEVIVREMGTRPKGCYIWNTGDKYIIEYNLAPNKYATHNPKHPGNSSRVICLAPPPCFLTCESSS